MSLPNYGTLLIRTSFEDLTAWKRLIDLVRTPTVEGIVSEVHTVDDTQFEMLSDQELRRMLSRAGNESQPVAFLADSLCLGSDELAVLAVDIRPGTAGQSFRCLPSMIWVPEFNLPIANIDWAELRNACDTDGVLRRF